MESILYQNKPTIEFNGADTMMNAGVRYPEDMKWNIDDYHETIAEVTREKLLAGGFTGKFQEEGQESDEESMQTM